MVSVVDKQVRHRIFTDRGGYQRAACDLCGAKGASDVHHIVPKSRTQSSPEAREASECVELMSLLCSQCHTGDNVHNPESAVVLLDINAERYGDVEVMAALKAVEDALNSHLNILHIFQRPPAP